MKILAAIFFILCCHSAALTQEMELRLAEPVERALKPKEAHAYEVRLKAGELVYAACEQRGIDLTLALQDSSGKEIYLSSANPSCSGTEQLYIYSPEDNVYRVVVSAKQDVVVEGRYRLTLSLPEVVDARITEVQTRLYSLSNKRGLPTKEDLKEYEAALGVLRKLGERKVLAALLTELGETYEGFRDPRAEAILEEALQLHGQLKDEAGEALALTYLGNVVLEAKDSAEAIGYYERALALWKKLDDSWGQAYTMNNLAFTYENIGEISKASSYYDRAYEIRKHSGSFSQQATTLHNISVFYDRAGEYQKALDGYLEALELWNKADKKCSSGHTLNALGTLYLNLGALN